MDTTLRKVDHESKHLEQILRASPAETFANNVPDDITKCFMCQDNEMFGIYITRLQQKENESKGIETKLLQGQIPDM